MSAIMLAEDRSLSVPPGRTVRTGYVSVWAVRLGCRERMAVGDVKQSYERRLQLGEHQPWPCPRGEWSGEPERSDFIIHDGRHEYVATLMLGHEYILVAWIE